MLIEDAHRSGARYVKCCEIIEITLRTLQRWKKDGFVDKRKGSGKRVVRKLSPEKREEIIMTCNSVEYMDMNPHQIIPRLLDLGKYLASVSTFYRILKAEKMLSHRSNCRLRQRRHKPPERKATKSNEVWCWDITWIPRTIKGLFFYAYVIIDIFDRYIVGWSVHEKESDSYSRDLFERVSLGRNIDFRYLHSDNGHAMKGVTLLSFLKDLNIDISFSRPRVSNDNPFIESFFRTMKYSSKYKLRFETIEDVRIWMADFVSWYNNEHFHSSIGYVTPAQMRNGDSVTIFKDRNEIMDKVKNQNPEIWGSRNAKVWKNPETVVLNPDKKV